MPKSKTTVHFVNTHGASGKTVQIPTHVVLYWKKYLIGFVTLFIILGGINSLLIYQKTSKLYQEKLARANKIKTMVDVKELKNSLVSIDSEMEKLNNYLKQRGIKSVSNAKVSNTLKHDITNVNETTEAYDKWIKKVTTSIHQIPLGWPYLGERSSRFGYRHNPFSGRGSEHHSGVDFKGPVGSPIKATASGKVTYAGYRGGYGKCVIIQHKNGYETLYAHMSALKVNVNQKIDGNTVVGLLGSTGRSTGPHLHYEVMKNGTKIDPEPFLNL